MSVNDIAPGSVSARRYVVGPAEIRPHTNTVLIGGEERYLRPQAMQVLVYLLQHPGELVTKETLYRAIWGDSAVTDDALVQCVVEIRKTLGDDPRRPQYVRTIPKAGYCFIGPVADPARTESVTVSSHGAAAMKAWLPRWAAGLASVVAVISVIVIDVWYTRPSSPSPTAVPSVSQSSGVITGNLEAYREYSMGLERANALQWNAALDHFNAAVKADPDFAMAHARIGYTYVVIMGWPQRGESYLARAFQLSDRLRERDRLSILAWYAQAKLDFEGAISPLRTLINRYPDDVESYWQLARVLRGEERWSEAEQVVLDGLRIDPKAKDLHNELRNVYTSTWRLDLARQEAEKYVELSPREANAHDSLGLVHQQAGRYDEALRHYREAMAIDPAFDIALFHIGNTLAEQGRYREALDAYQRHVDMMTLPEMKLRGTAAQGWVHFVRGDLANAWRLITLVPSEPAIVRYDIAVVALARGVRERFDAEMRKPMTTSNRGTRAPRLIESYMRGKQAQADGDAEAALAAYRDAISHAPTPWAFPTLNDCLGQALFDFHRWADARAEYERLLTLNPSEGRYYYRLAQIADREGRKNDAAALYREFITKWQDADADAPELISARAWLQGADRSVSNALSR